MEKFNKTYKSKEEILIILEKRFEYLPKEERNKLVRGNEFVQVPSEELKKLRIDVYQYLM